MILAEIIVFVVVFALLLAVLSVPFYLAWQLYLKCATNKKPHLGIGGNIGCAFLWLLFVGFSLPLGVLPFFDVPFVLLFGWTVGLWRFYSGFQIEPAAVIVGGCSLMFFFISLHFLLRGILKPYEKRWTFHQTTCVGGILLAVSVSGIALLAGIHEIYWAATSKGSWIDGGYTITVARRMQTQNNTRNIGLGILNYDAARKFATGGTILPDGRLGHSWETQILPYLEETTLFNQINREKPWTDPEHRTVFETPIRLFESVMGPRGKQHNAAGYALSYYAVNERVLPVGEKVSFDSIAEADGTSKTILLGEVKGNVRAWGDPINGRDPALGINKSPYGFGGYFKGGAVIGICDGSVTFLSDDIDPVVLHALATPDGGEEVTLP